MKTRILSFVILGLFSLTSCHKDHNLGDNTEATSVQLTKPTVSLVVGGREKLLTIVEPVGATLSNAKWTSLNPSVATVSEKGTVNALAVGQTTITLSAGNKPTEQCTLTVIASPITDLVMPEIDYPIAKEAIVILQGTGFTTNDKIRLRKVTGLGLTLKSAQTGDDILAQIHKQAANYISFYCSVTPGWYSVVLEKDNTQYELGNMDVETPNIPEYVYDKNKIFWDDTHWRWMQLRGKVKDMTVEQIGSFPNDMIFHYRFNNKGFLSSSVSSWGDSTSNTFDSKNRLTSSINYSGNNSLTSWSKSSNSPIYKYTYSYSDYEKYYRLNISRGGIEIINYWGHGGYDREDPGNLQQGIWVKGLTGITNEEYTDTYNYIFNITCFSDSIKTIRAFNGILGVTERTITSNYNKVFPFKELDFISKDKYSIGNYVIRTFEFSPVGIPINTTEDSYAKGNNKSYGSLIGEYVINSPFQLHSSFKYATGQEFWSYKYDTNWNMISYTTSSTTDYKPISTYNYLSYDEKGNWTQCAIIEKNSLSEGKNIVWKLTRDITYW